MREDESNDPAPINEIAKTEAALASLVTAARFAGIPAEFTRHIFRIFCIFL